MLKRLFQIVDARARGAIVGMIAITALAAILRVAAIFALLPVLEGLLRDSPVMRWGWVVVSATLALAAVLAARVRERVAIAASHRASVSMSLTLSRHVATLPVGWFDNVRQSDLAELLTEGRRVLASVLRWPVVFITTAVSTCIAAVLVAVGMLPSLSVVLLTTAGTVAFGGQLVSATIRRASAEADNARLRAVTELAEYAQAQPVLRAFTGLAAGRSRVQGSLTELRTAERIRLRAFLTGTVLVPDMIGALAFGATLLTGVLTATSPAVLVVALLLTLANNEAIHPLGRSRAVIGEAAQFLLRAARILEHRPLPEPAIPVLPAGNELCFDSVSFSYESGKAALQQVSFTAGEGEITAVVGPSGAGKSTLLRLSARFWDPSSGHVTIGGVDLRDIGSAGVLNRVAFVFQDVYLFNGTIRENVLTARPSASDTELAEAASRSGLAEVIATLPDGWDTLVGERGATLSGGQKQRVSIARAFLKDAPILLLDEATAALDAENGEHFANAIRELAIGRTVVTVTHRLESLLHVDRVVVLDAGRVTQTGDHNELVRQPGTYAKLWAAHQR